MMVTEPNEFFGPNQSTCDAWWRITRCSEKTKQKNKTVSVEFWAIEKDCDRKSNAEGVKRHDTNDKEDRNRCQQMPMANHPMVAIGGRGRGDQVENANVNFESDCNVISATGRILKTAFRHCPTAYTSLLSVQSTCFLVKTRPKTNLVGLSSSKFFSSQRHKAKNEMIGVKVKHEENQLQLWSAAG